MKLVIPSFDKMPVVNLASFANVKLLKPDEQYKFNSQTRYMEMGLDVLTICFLHAMSVKLILAPITLAVLNGCRRNQDYMWMFDNDETLASILSDAVIHKILGVADYKGELYLYPHPDLNKWIAELEIKVVTDPSYSPPANTNAFKRLSTHFVLNK